MNSKNLVKVTIFRGKNIICIEIIKSNIKYEVKFQNFNTFVQQKEILFFYETNNYLKIDLKK